MSKNTDEAGGSTKRMRHFLVLYLIVAFVIFMVILTGVLDSLLLPIVEKMFGKQSQAVLQDARMVSVLILFSLSFVGVVLGLLQTTPDHRLVVIIVTGVFMTHFVYMVKGFPEEQHNYKALYIALVIFIALMLPIALTSSTDKSTQLKHVYATFGVVLSVSCVVGLLYLLLTPLLWPVTKLVEISGPMRFVISPMAIVTVSTTWGLMACYRLIPKWGSRKSGGYWLLVYLAFAALLAFFYGWIFLAPKEWVIIADLGPWKAGFVAQSLLLPNIIVLAICFQFGRFPVNISGWISVLMLCALAQLMSAGWVASLLESGTGKKYPYNPDVDFIPFVLTHTLASATAILLLPLILLVMRSYPWSQWQWMGKLLK